MKKELRQQVWSRAHNICEYCRIPQELDPLPFGIDHIKAQYHHGQTILSNLSLACFGCNTYKAANAGGYDPVTDELTPLFNPRSDVWEEHFTWRGAELEGQTPVGRVTIDVLRINLPDRVEQRRVLMMTGLFPLGRPS